jgi:hypothetical protein
MIVSTCVLAGVLFGVGFALWRQEDFNAISVSEANGIDPYVAFYDPQGIAAKIALNERALELRANGKDERYEVFGVGQTAATAVEVAGGTGLTCVGLGASGAAAIGTTEGVAHVDDAADFLRFAVPLPALWLDNAQTDSLVPELDVLEVAGENCDLTVAFYVHGSTSPIQTNSVTLTNEAARAWVATTGLGFVTGLDVDDSYVLVEIRSVADADDFLVYGFRWRYRLGIVGTQ